MRRRTFFGLVVSLFALKVKVKPPDQRELYRYFYNQRLNYPPLDFHEELPWN